MASSNLANPAAIVLSSVILATGLYFGLQRTAQPVVMPPITGPVVPPDPPVGPPRPVEMSAETRARGVEDARLALEGAREEMVRRCWTPAAAKQPEPRQIPLMFNMSFSAQGEMTGFGVSEDRAAHRPEVANCVRLLGLPLRVRAPGSLLLVEVPFTLP